MGLYRYFRENRRARRAELLAIIDALETELAAERAITNSLQAALVVAVDPAKEETIVQAPDGEFFIPSAYDFEHMAHQMWDMEKDE